MLVSVKAFCQALLFSVRQHKDTISTLTCSLGPTDLQTVLVWADAEPAARRMHVKQLCDHIPAARMLSVKHHDELLQLPCTPAVRAAVAQWLETNQQDATAAAAHDGSCMPADVTRQQACAQGQLLVAGGHDVTWQSLRSVSMLVRVSVTHALLYDVSECAPPKQLLASFMRCIRACCCSWVAELSCWEVEGSTVMNTP